MLRPKRQSQRAIAQGQEGREERVEKYVAAGAIGSLHVGQHWNPGVTYRGNKLLLPAREFALMQTLMERPGTILSRAQVEERL